MTNIKLPTKLNLDWHNFDVKQKIERFHKQIKYGIFWSNNPNMYKN